MEVKGALGNTKTCAACGEIKNPSKLGYDIRNLKAYCLNHACGHPDHPGIDLIKSKKHLILDAIEQNYNEEAKKALGKWLGKATSIRPNVTESYYLALLGQEKEIDTKHGILAEIIRFYMEHNPLDAKLETDAFIDWSPHNTTPRWERNHKPRPAVLDLHEEEKEEEEDIFTI